jgi:hypothetical protein
MCVMVAMHATHEFGATAGRLERSIGRISTHATLTHFLKARTRCLALNAVVMVTLTDRSN